MRGPIPYTLQHPVEWTLLEMRTRRAVATPTGSLDVAIYSAYTSIYRNDSTTDESVVIDAELWENSFAARYGIVPGGDLEVEIPVLYASSGFLDQFVDAWHSFFHLSDGGRSDRPANDYEVSIESNGNEIYSLSSGEFMLGDIPITWTQQILDEEHDGLALAARAALQLPTGSQSKGTSNGALDWGVGLLAERTLERWTLFGTVDFADSGTSDAFADEDVEIREQIGASLGAEYRWNASFSWLADVSFNSPITRDLDLKVINRELLDLGVGGAWDVGESSRMTLSFHEDLISYSGPDFGVLLSWTYRF